MASITIRNLDDDLKRRLRVRAAKHGRSMEEEAREILRQVVGESAPPRNLAAAIRARVAPFGGVHLDLPTREPMREPPRFARKAGMIVLDTDIVSNLLRPAPAPQVEAWLSAQDGATVWFTAVGEAELRYGVAILPAGRRRSALSEAIEDMLDEDFRDRMLPFDRPPTRAYAAIATERRAVGWPIGQFDCQIAAVARADEAAVATLKPGITGAGSR